MKQYGPCEKKGGLQSCFVPLCECTKGDQVTDDVQEHIVEQAKADRTEEIVEWLRANNRSRLAEKVEEAFRGK